MKTRNEVAFWRVQIYYTADNEFPSAHSSPLLFSDRRFSTRLWCSSRRIRLIIALSRPLIICTYMRAWHASSRDKIQLRSVTRNDTSRDTRGNKRGGRSNQQLSESSRESIESRRLSRPSPLLELSDELFPIDRNWYTRWNDWRVSRRYQLSDVIIAAPRFPPWNRLKVNRGCTHRSQWRWWFVHSSCLPSSTPDFHQCTQWIIAARSCADSGLFARRATNRGRGTESKGGVQFRSIFSASSARKRFAANVFLEEGGKK